MYILYSEAHLAAVRSISVAYDFKIFDSAHIDSLCAIRVNIITRISGQTVLDDSPVINF